MKIIKKCTEVEFNKLFDERLFNPASDDTDFDVEFESAIDFVGRLLEKYVGAESFTIHQYRNGNSRFIDVAFNSEVYLSSSLLLALQHSLDELSHDWMVCLWEGCFIFVTPKDIKGYDPSNSDPLFERLVKNSDNP